MGKLGFDFVLWVLVGAMSLASVIAAPAVPPPRMVWSWNAGDVKRGLPTGTGVAFLMANLQLDGSRDIAVRLRREAVGAPRGAFRMGVIRLDVGRAAKYTARQRAQVAQIVAEAVEMARAPAIQIDFDAPKSAWPFYRELLRDVRGRIGRDVFLSMMALVSWCGKDSWLAGVAVDEIVPMYFEMGRFPEVESQLAYPGCRASAGVSASQPLVVPGAKRVYLFPK